VHTLALVLLYGPPDRWLLEQSHHSLWSCERQGNCGLVVVDVKNILSVVAMIPHSPRIPGNAQVGERFFVHEKIGLEVANMGGFQEQLMEL